MTTTTTQHTRQTMVRAREDLDPKDFWAWLWRSVYPSLGWLLIGIGALAIGLGWWGVARNSIVAKQLPYLASGGLIGVGLIVLGGRFLLIQELRHDSRRLDRLERMVDELHRVLLAGAHTNGLFEGAADEHSNGTTFAILPRGRRYHRSNCSMVAGKDASYVGAGDIRERGLEPCPLCEPEPVPA